MRRVAVTGASGFIGRALVAQLAGSGHAVRAASRSPAHLPLPPGEAGERVERVASPDLAADPDWARLFDGVDTVVHAAAIAHTRGIDAAAYEAVNNRAVASLAEAARGKVERVVFLSSIRAQSPAAAEGVLSEADPPRPADPYGRSKLAAEEALARSGVPYVILRPVLVAGPDPAGNLAALLRFAAAALPLRLDGLAARRSLVALPDMVSAVAHVLAGSTHLGETYIVAHPEPIVIGEMFGALREGLGRSRGGIPVPAALLRAATGIAGRGLKEKLFGDLMASPAKLMASGWSPRVTPRAALVGIGQRWVESHPRR